jgi:hypothetical protein
MVEQLREKNNSTLIMDSDRFSEILQKWQKLKEKYTFIFSLGFCHFCKILPNQLESTNNLELI